MKLPTPISDISFPNTRFSKFENLLPKLLGILVMPSLNTICLHLVYNEFGQAIPSALSDKLLLNSPVPEILNIFVSRSNIAVTSSLVGVPIFTEKESKTFVETVVDTPKYSTVISNEPGSVTTTLLTVYPLVTYSKPSEYETVMLYTDISVVSPTKYVSDE